MRIREELYYAPNIKFSELDKTGRQLPDQFEKRIRGYYLEPAIKLAKAGYAFASGVLLVTCIDALARAQTENQKVGDRFKAWCEKELPSFREKNLSRRFYEDFRNGLVHEARIKNGCEFSLKSESTVQEKGKILSINPLYLGKELSDALACYIKLLKGNDKERKRLSEKVLADFAYEINR